MASDARPTHDNDLRVSSDDLHVVNEPTVVSDMDERPRHWTDDDHHGQHGSDEHQIDHPDDISVDGTAVTDTAATDATTVMGAEAQIRIVGGPASLADLAAAELDALEGLWAGLLPDHQLHTVAHQLGHAAPLSARTRRMVRQVIDAHAHDGGAFDPAQLLELVALGTAAGEAHRGDASDPEPERLPDAVLMSSAAANDDGVIGRGLAADLVAEALISHGAEGVLVAIGGDVRVAGSPPRGHDWTIDVHQPRIPYPSLRRLHLHDGGIATCSVLPASWLEPPGDDAEHHGWDAAAGFPTDSAVVTATVLAGTGAWAQTLASACLTLEPAEARGMLEEHGADAHLVLQDGTVLEVGRWATFAS
jgi:thiamine biosynthesis lipoprotein